MIYADRGYDHDKYDNLVRDKGITPQIARRGEADGCGLGTHRRVVEQTIALLHGFCRLRTRWQLRDDIDEALSSPVPSSATADSSNDHSVSSP
jgi:hypothetical protein